MREQNVNVPELFGSLVFNEETMQQRLSGSTYAAWKQCLEDGSALDSASANEIASAMKDWAVEKGATHFTHWFQPMTGFTAEKHDSFITPIGKGKVMMELSGKELARGEADASSFPSGGLRATFEARGYTAWDPNAYAFVKDGTLYIPTVFCSYSGEALDKKTPLLRSMDAINRASLRILRLFGDTDVRRVSPQVGPEQEYFLIDKELYRQREDLVLCGRTLFGAKPPKGQELDDHYYGAIKPRVAAFMRELDAELWKVGTLAKTKHNEVAPAQHELAPIYCDVNTACDQNQLTMELMKTVADRHGLVCLLHEKPFAGLNGSGKHNNWSLATDTGKNLLAPGKTPSQNARFLLFLAAFIKGVDEYAEIMRCTVSSAGNDNRLGGNEAPPAVISIFLGDELTNILKSIIYGTEYVDVKKKTLKIGIDSIPTIPQDTTDRNRTSPIAFTGNKFEFRMLGSSQSIAGPNAAINTVMAEELTQFAEILEQAEDFNAALQKLLHDTFEGHKRIIFNGNGYDKAWEAEAEKRGLPILRSCAESLPAYVLPKNVALFTRHKIFSPQELQARCDIHLESYCKTIRIEASTMTDMIRRSILPAVSSYIGALAESVNSRRAAVANVSAKPEEALIAQLSRLSARLWDACGALEKTLSAPGAEAETGARAVYYRETVVSAMEKARTIADELETLTAADRWPFPTYAQLLFQT